MRSIPAVTESAACARSANGAARSSVRGSSLALLTRMPRKRGEVRATAAPNGVTEPSATAKTPWLTGTAACVSDQSAAPPLAAA
ncbi:MAG: hypothetical protein IPI48_09670 [bacterium]|nr:hypothetical protein [bacterium]